jgi:DNA-binding beta-propeller fold protein YncE
VVAFDLPSPLRLEEGDSRSLFVTWDVQATLEGEGLRPAMTIAPQLRQLLADLVYAACPDIDTIFVIRSDRNWVADSFGIRGNPNYLAIDPGRQRLYVLAPRESAIKVVDLSSQRVVDFFHLPIPDPPTYMTISPDGMWAYVLEERSSHLSRIDLATGRSAARVRLEYRPQYALYIAERNHLAVSLGLTQTVSLLHPMELTEVSRVITGDSPRGLLFSHNQLYVAESGDHTVSIMDLATPRSLRRLDVGFGPRRLLGTENFIYVSNYDGDSLSVLVPGQLGVVRDIPGLARPLEMAFDQVRRQLFVGEEGAAGLAVIDTTSNLLLRRITLGARPAGLAVLP